MKLKLFSTVFFTILFSLVISINAFAYEHEYNENDVIIDYLPGDADCNNLLTAADARLVLRASAQLEELTNAQIKTVDLDGTGVVNSSLARRILRASAKIEPIKITVNLKVGQNIVVGPLKGPTGWEWNYYMSLPSKFDIKENNYYYSGDEIGSAPDKFVTLTPAEPGEYLVELNQVTGWNQKLYRSFNLFILVKT